jgi:radical SAM superfamily enzyme YgiQ (UPF0313 family)
MMTGNRILLISSNRCIVPYPVFPLGIAHVAAALRSASYTVRFFDALDSRRDLEAVLKSFKPHHVGISLRNIDDLRISGCRVFADEVVPIVKLIRRLCDATVILGGSGYSLFPREMLALTGADFGIQGEGEDALPALLGAISRKAGFSGIPGLVYRRGQSIAVNTKKALAPGRIPPPAYPARLSQWYVTRSSMLGVQTQRGCPFRCCYCTYPVIEGRKARYRAPQDIVMDLVEAKKRGCRYFFIVDSVFNTSASHVVRICEEILSSRLNLSWGCFLRPRGLTAEMTGLMARAGCRHIEFGSDSFCDSVLDAYGKHFTFDDILRSHEMARNARIHCAHFLIIGGPGESRSSVIETFENSKKLRKTVFFPFIGMRVYPGTALHAIARREGLLRDQDGLLKPRFYVTPRLSRSAITALLGRFHRERPNWVVGETPDSLVGVMNGLRAAGVKGPLWEFQAR